MWNYRGQHRPEFAVEPAPGQESAWDYPRPPALSPCTRLVEVVDEQSEVLAVVGRDPGLDQVDLTAAADVEPRSTEREVRPRQDGHPGGARGSGPTRPRSTDRSTPRGHLGETGATPRATT